MRSQSKSRFSLELQAEGGPNISRKQASIRDWFKAISRNGSVEVTPSLICKNAGFAHKNNEIGEHYASC